jgi:hypothetical protein
VDKVVFPIENTSSFTASSVTGGHVAYTLCEVYEDRVGVDVDPNWVAIDKEVRVDN